MNIYDYIDNYGMYTFKEREINLIDKVIFSFLSYANFQEIVKYKKITLKEAGRMHLGLHKVNEINIIAVKEANKILRYMKDTKRYKDCLLYNYVYEGTNKVQFSAICIEYQKNKVYVSYEGTDQLISGWKEDIVLSYQTNTISHRRAIRYINRCFTFTKKELIVGGHSKGGNLALIASMYANPLVKRQIKEIYNVDGPGLLDQQFYSEEFKKILPKYKHIIPDNSFVGMCLNNTNETVIKTTIKGPITHNIAYWKIKNDEFILSKLSPYSRELRKDILNWIAVTNKNDIRKFANNFQIICENAGVDSLLDIKNKKSKILELIEESKNIDEQAKEVFLNFMKIVLKSFGDTYIEELKSKIKKYID